MPVFQDAVGRLYQNATALSANDTMIVSPSVGQLQVLTASPVAELSVLMAVFTVNTAPYGTGGPM